MFERYGKMWQAYQNGEISEKVWIAFVNECFEQILDDNKDVLVRLKNI